MKISAFTLSEVLITLGIIGVVATITIPTVVGRNKYKALETGLHKSYSIMQQALNMYQAKEGQRLVPEMISGDANSADGLKNQLKPYLNIVYDCGNSGHSNTKKDCIPYSPDHPNSTYKTFDNRKLRYFNYFDDGQFILSDGSLILLNQNLQPVGKLYITVDVNGKNNKPDKLGYDIFTFQIVKDGRLLPAGAKDTDFTNEETYCSITSTNDYNGLGCTAKALSDKNYFKKLH